MQIYFFFWSVYVIMKTKMLIKIFYFHSVKIQMGKLQLLNADKSITWVIWRFAVGKSVIAYCMKSQQAFIYRLDKTVLFNQSHANCRRRSFSASWPAGLFIKAPGYRSHYSFHCVRDFTYNLCPRTAIPGYSWG